MKKIQFALFALVLSLGTSSFASFPGFPSDGPVIHPGPIQAVDANGLEVLQVLTKNADKFQEFANTAELVGIGATVQHLNPDVSRYQITGLRLVQGDIIDGSVTLTITQTRHQSEFQFPQPYYFTYEAVITVQE